MTEIWAMGYHARASDIAPRAQRYEAANFDGYLVTDSQNLWKECWVALTAAALSTDRIGLGVYVTNPVTRHPAVTASAAASLQELAGRRVVLGVGRGDSALAHIGYGLVPTERFGRYLHRLQGYLRGESVPFAYDDGPSLPRAASLGYGNLPSASRIRWLPAVDEPKVMVDVATSGARVMRLAAQAADGVTFAFGADVDRVVAAIEDVRRACAAAGRSPDSLSVSALVPLVLHKDLDRARDMAAGMVATIGRWMVQQGGEVTASLEEGQRSQLRAVTAAYDMTKHGETSTAQSQVLSAEMIDRLAIVGPPERCLDRVRRFLDLGLERIVISPQVRGAAQEDEETHAQLLIDELLPALR